MHRKLSVSAYFLSTIIRLSGKVCVPFWTGSRISSSPERLVPVQRQCSWRTIDRPTWQSWICRWQLHRASRQPGRLELPARMFESFS